MSSEPKSVEIESRHFTTAATFINALRRTDPYWLSESNWQVPWVFRGQRCEKPKLIPSAWRDGIENDVLYQWADLRDVDERVKRIIADPLKEALRLGEYPDYIRRLVIQHGFEGAVVRAFAQMVDELGLPLPGGSYPESRSFHPFRWLDYDFVCHPAVGLAQHHGMPTRLLDWTLNPLIAAFFAADTASPDEEGNIIVWALDRSNLGIGDCCLFTVQRSQIGFLHAQEGLFTYISTGDVMFAKSGRWPSLEEIVPPDGLRRMTLPKREVPTLKRLLWAERISKAHLMPTLDNVKVALRDVWKLLLADDNKLKSAP
jgi:hypothetical protein